MLETIIEATLHFALQFSLFQDYQYVYIKIVFLNEDQVYARQRAESEKLEHRLMRSYPGDSQK